MVYSCMRLTLITFVIYGDETKEKKDKDKTGKEVAATQISLSVYLGQGCYIDALIFAVSSAEDYGETADGAQITQEKIGIEDEIVSETLNNDYDEKTCDSVLRIYRFVTMTPEPTSKVMTIRLVTTSQSCRK